MTVKETLRIAASRILKFNIATESVSVCTNPLGIYDLLVDSNILWATAGSNGIIKFDMSSESVVATYMPSSSPCLLAKDAGGNIWFSMNWVQRVGKIVEGVITEYDLKIGVNPITGEPYMDPYGLCFDDYGSLWIACYDSKKMLRFDPATASVVENHDLGNAPYYPIKDNAGNIWCWGQGSIDMNKVNLPTLPKVETTLSVQAPSTATVGQSITVQGTLSGAYSPSYMMTGIVQNAPIDLTSTWGLNLATMTSIDGKFIFTFNVSLAEGEYEMVVEFKGDLYFASSKVTLQLTVTKITNLLLNPSVEDDKDSNGIPDYWSKYVTGGITATCSWVSDSHTGQKGVKVVLTQNPSLSMWCQATWCQSTSKVTVGKTYKLRVWYKSNVKPMIMLVAWSGSAVIKIVPLELPVSSSWVQSEWLYMTVPFGTTSLRADGKLFNTAGGWVVYDDFELVEA